MHHAHALGDEAEPPDRGGKEEKAARAEILALSALHHGTQILLCRVLGDGRRDTERGYCPFATGHRTGRPRRILPTVEDTAYRR